MLTDFDNFNRILSVVQKIKMTFVDSLGNIQKGTGTGFWIKTNQGRFLFVTNKHNVVPQLHSKFQNNDYTLKECTLNFRLLEIQTKEPSIKKTTELDMMHWELKFNDDPTAPDVAIFDPMWQSPQIPDAELAFLQLTCPVIPQNLLAENEFFTNKLSMGDACHFTGFPMIQAEDAMYKLPILRTCNVSSYTLIDYFDEQPGNVQTKNICLVNGLSFGGSSGSPIFNFSKGIKVGAGLTGGGYIEPKLIGIMSGHWEEHLGKNDLAAEKMHSGLSYFTKSAAILNLIAAHNL